MDLMATCTRRPCTVNLTPVGRNAPKIRQVGILPKPRHVAKRFRTIPRAEAPSSNDEPASEPKPSSSVKMVDNSARDARRAANSARDARRASNQADQAPAESTVASRVQMVQLEEKESLTGVTNVDRGEASDDELLGRALMLAAVDIALLVLFAAIGQSQHGSDSEVLKTAAPFIVGWLVAAPVTGVYSPQACTNNVGQAAVAAVKNWAVGMPVGLVLRSIFKGYMAPKSFVIVTMVVTGVLLVGWRAGAASLIKAPDGSSSKGNRKGGPLEFLKLLFGLSTRW
eukprot:1316-Pyramimonas_sp.AAC.1